ncbi:helix-turn-helix domain-containing protein [bacterium]|nr:helix-turn-helix domain-containing protein [bacterium]
MDPFLNELLSKKKDNSETEEWLNSNEAAAYLKISRQVLMNLSSNGKVPFYKFGRRNRYLKSQLRDLLMANPRGVSHGN